MISGYLRILLLFGSVLNFICVIHYVKRSYMKIEDTIFWIVSAFIIALFGLFPHIPMQTAYLLQVEAPVNYVFLVLIAVLYIKCFHLSIKMSKQNMDIELISAQLNMPKEVEKKKDFLLIIPAYNEADNIVNVINQVRKYDYDYIVVNDGSTDDTERLLVEHKVPHITNIRNMGLASAFRAGVRFAEQNDYDVVLQFDADGQHIASQVDLVMNTLAERGDDILIGSRFVNKAKDTNEGGVKRFTRKYISFVIWMLSRKWVYDPTSGMRAYKKDAYKRFLVDYNLVPEPDGILYFLRKGFSVSEVSVEMRDRLSGESYLNLTAAIRYMIRVTASMLVFQWRRN